MSDYQITRICSDKSLILPSTRGFGSIDIRPASSDLPFETTILRQSAQRFEEIINWEMAQRISTIVTADTADEADNLATVQFEQVLDCFDKMTFGLGISELYSSGMIRNLNTYWNSPRLPGINFGPFPAFERRSWTIEPVNESQALLSMPDNELKMSILRSYHWLRKAKIESSTQLKCIFKWFSVETLTKVGESEDVSGKILQALGFPLGNIGIYMPRPDVLSLQKHMHYDLAFRKYQNLLAEIRQFRNNTVHSGFRQWDLAKNKLNDFEELLYISVPRLQKFAVDALYKGIESVSEFWEYFPILFSERPIAELINDLHGNTLVQIAHPHILRNGAKTITFNPE